MASCTKQIKARHATIKDVTTNELITSRIKAPLRISGPDLIWSVNHDGMTVDGLVQSSGIAFFPIDQNPVCNSHVIWLDETNHHLQIGDRDLITPPIGPVGPAGEDGCMGEEGPRGDTGPRGIDGQPGTDKGPTGYTGPTGDDGKNGINGIDGVPGTPGNPGMRGPVGSRGPAGRSGQQLLFSSGPFQANGAISPDDAVSGLSGLRRVPIVTGQVLRLDFKAQLTAAPTTFPYQILINEQELINAIPSSGGYAECSTFITINQFTIDALSTFLSESPPIIFSNEISRNDATVVTLTLTVPECTISSMELYAFLPGNDALRIFQITDDVTWTSQYSSFHLVYNCELSADVTYDFKVNSSEVIPATTLSVTTTGFRQVNLFGTHDNGDVKGFVTVRGPAGLLYGFFTLNQPPIGIPIPAPTVFSFQVAGTQGTQVRFPSQLYFFQ